MPEALRSRSAGLRVAFYVQHLLGIGHLARAFRIAEAMAASGWAVDLLVGGVVPAGMSAGRVTIVPLPPVRAGSSGFSALEHPDGTPFDETAQRARRDILIAHVSETRPDVLLVEAFPFGRRQMRFELLPLLEACSASSHRPLIASSIRDILQETRRPDRVAETMALLDRSFDLVLVHGDPALASLDASFPRAAEIAGKLAYTGLVAPAASRTKVSEAEAFDVVVSAGGGAVGVDLLRAAILARPSTRFAGGRWLFLTGPNLPHAARDALAGAANDRVVVRSFVPDLASWLGSAAVSVSQAGYNTVADLLVAGCPAVLVPFAAGGETEQSVRASLLAARRRAVVVTERDLTPARLAAAIDSAVDLPGLATRFDLDGAQRTAQLLARAVAARRSSTTDRTEPSPPV